MLGRPGLWRVSLAAWDRERLSWPRMADANPSTEPASGIVTLGTTVWGAPPSQRGDVRKAREASVLSKRRPAVRAAPIT
jgi:hypothetical protein